MTSGRQLFVRIYAHCFATGFTAAVRRYEGQQQEAQ